MSADNGVVRIGRKGIKKFAFGDGEPFEVDVVTAFQQWIEIDETFRPEEASVDANTGQENRMIELGRMQEYHQAAVAFVGSLAGGEGITVAEALDFLARLREQYDELAHFFRPNLREEPGSRGTSEVQSEMRFSAEALEG